MANGIVTTQGGDGGWGFLGGQQPAPAPKYGTVPYAPYNPASLPGNPGFSNPDLDPSKMFSSLLPYLSLLGSGSGSNLDYSLYTPQEIAQRGLDINGLKQALLNGQGNYLGAQSQQNDLFNQIAAAALGRQRDATALKANQDYHTAQGQFASQGSISSEAARQALGSAPSAWKDTQPWMAPSGQPGMGGSMGDIRYSEQNAQKDLYDQLLQQNSNYNLKKLDLYNQLLGNNVTQGTLNQSNDAYNRLLSGQYFQPTDQQKALYSALSGA